MIRKYKRKGGNTKADKSIYITEKSLIENGFERNKNMFINRSTKVSVCLHKGHTWLMSHPHMKWSKSVRSIEEIEKYYLEIK